MLDMMRTYKYQFVALVRIRSGTDFVNLRFSLGKKKQSSKRSTHCVSQCMSSAISRVKKYIVQENSAIVSARDTITRIVFVNLRTRGYRCVSLISYYSMIHLIECSTRNKLRIYRSRRAFFSFSLSHTRCARARDLISLKKTKTKKQKKRNLRKCIIFHYVTRNKNSEIRGTRASYKRGEN